MGAWQITKKDLRLLSRDRRAFVVLLVFPLVFIAVLGVPATQMLGWRDGNQVIEVALVNESQSDEANRVIAALKNHRSIRPFDAKDHEDGRRVFKLERCTVLITFGKRFSERLAEVDIESLLKNRDESAMSVLEELDIQIDKVVSKPSASEIVADLICLISLQESVDGIPADLQEVKTVTDVTGDTPGIHSSKVIYTQLVPSYTVMFAFFLVNVMARSFITERELGTLNRLRMTPVSPAGLLLGKTLPFLIISIIQGICLFVLGRIIFGMPWGDSPWLLIPVIICTSMAATSLGLMIATMVKTDSQVSAYGNFIVIGMAGVSGCFMPRDWMPAAFQRFAMGLPHSWSLIGFEQILAPVGPDLAIVLQSCIVLIAFAGLFFAAGCWRLKSV